MQKGDIKLEIEIPEDLYIRIKRAKSVPDLTGTDITNAVLCISRGSELVDIKNEKEMQINETVEHDGKTYTYIESHASTMPVVEYARFFIDRCKGMGLYCTRMNGTMIYSDETFEQFDKRWKAEREEEQYDKYTITDGWLLE